MPIVMPKTGPAIPPEISQQDRNRLWEAIVRNYAESHPGIFTAVRSPEENPEFED